MKEMIDNYMGIRYTVFIESDNHYQGKKWLSLNLELTSTHISNKVKLLLILLLLKESRYWAYLDFLHIEIYLGKAIRELN